MLPSTKGHSSTFMLSQFTHFLPPYKQTLVLTVHWLLNTCIFAFIILLYVDNYPWDMHVESWKQLLKLKSSFVLLRCLYFEFIALWVNSYARLLMLVLKVLFMKSFAICYLFVSNYRSLPWVTAFISYAL